jgi:hypothetical protein
VESDAAAVAAEHVLPHHVADADLAAVVLHTDRAEVGRRGVRGVELDLRDGQAAGARFEGVDPSGPVGHVDAAVGRDPNRPVGAGRTRQPDVVHVGMDVVADHPVLEGAVARRWRRRWWRGRQWRSGAGDTRRRHERRAGLHIETPHRGGEGHRVVVATQVHPVDDADHLDGERLVVVALVLAGGGRGPDVLQTAHDGRGRRGRIHMVDLPQRLDILRRGRLAPLAQHVHPVVRGIREAHPADALVGARRARVEVGHPVICGAEVVAVGHAAARRRRRVGGLETEGDRDHDAAVGVGAVLQPQHVGHQRLPAGRQAHEGADGRPRRPGELAGVRCRAAG